MDNKANDSNESNEKNISKSYIDLYQTIQNSSSPFYDENDKSEHHNYSGK